MEVRKLEAEHYHPMEARYDLYGDLELPAPGTLGPALREDQPATREFWHRLGDLENKLTTQVQSRRQQSKGGLPPLAKETYDFFQKFWPTLRSAVNLTLNQFYRGEGDTQR